jgi:hypothetical protein
LLILEYAEEMGFCWNFDRGDLEPDHVLGYARSNEAEGPAEAIAADKLRAELKVHRNSSAVRLIVSVHPHH